MKLYPLSIYTLFVPQQNYSTALLPFPLLALADTAGALGQDRTAALLIKSQLLYQLSYERIFGSFCFRKVFQPKLIANLNCVHQFSSDLLLVVGTADGARSRNT